MRNIVRPKIGKPTSLRLCAMRNRRRDEESLGFKTFRLVVVCMNNRRRGEISPSKEGERKRKGARGKHKANRDASSANVCRVREQVR